VSTFAKVGATAALGFMAGRLSAEPHIRRLRGRLHAAVDSAGHDRLTGLPNRLLAAQVFAHRERRGLPTVLALVDLDGFKHINDSHGHQVGDELLRAVAIRLMIATNGYGGTAARIGGDEFLLMLPVRHHDPAEQVADILHTVAQPAKLRTDDCDVNVRPSASAGIAVYDGVNGTFATVLRHADIALYQAKRQRSSHRMYGPDMHMPRHAGRHGPRLRDQRPTDDSGLGGWVTQ
jgi:diguanylate cyclase